MQGGGRSHDAEHAKSGDVEYHRRESDAMA